MQNLSAMNIKKKSSTLLKHSSVNKILTQEKNRFLANPSRLTHKLLSVINYTKWMFLLSHHGSTMRALKP